VGCYLREGQGGGGPLGPLCVMKVMSPFSFLFTVTQFMALMLTDTSQTGTHSINPSLL
jgi:hypothetical protein